MKWFLKLQQRGLMAELNEGTDLPGAKEVAPAEEAEPEVEVEPESNQIDDFMDSLFKDDDEEVPEEKAQVEPELEPEPEPEPEPEVKEEPKVEPEEPKVEPEVKKEVKKEEETKEEVTPESLEEQRNQYLASVEKDFAISEEDANLIVTEPEKVLPRLATQIYDRAMRDTAEMFRNFSEQMPQMLNNVSKQQTQASEAEQLFLAANPGIEVIEKDELETLVNTFAPLVTQQNPNASTEEKLKALGRTIAAAKGISLSEAKQELSNKEEIVQPHSPAAPTRSGAQPQPAPVTETDAFIDMLINDDD